MGKQTFSILVTGGAGYIGSVLCPKLIALGHKVTIFDTLFWGANFPSNLIENSRLTIIKGDIRDGSQIDKVLKEGSFDRVIHLAAISNDPCSDLDDGLTTAVNLDATDYLMRAAKSQGVGRFIYASSASVYGIKDTPDVTEELELNPITLYAKYKAQGERILSELVDGKFEGVSVRAATVCGYSPRLRLDLTVNIFTFQAVCEGRVRIFGGSQMRPNIHIKDLVDFYILMLDQDNVSGESYNVSYSNASVRELADLVVSTTGENAGIEVEDSHDNRSYHLAAAKAKAELGFEPKHSIEDAIMEVAGALRNSNVVADPNDKKYRNVQFMCEDLGAWM